MATRWQRCAQLLSSHPYHSAISSAPCFALGARDDDDDEGDHGAAGAGAFAGNFARQDNGPGALTSPRPAAELPRGAVSATDRFFVSPARSASCGRPSLCLSSASVSTGSSASEAS